MPEKNTKDPKWYKRAFHSLSYYYNKCLLKIWAGINLFLSLAFFLIYYNISQTNIFSPLLSNLVVATFLISLTVFIYDLSKAKYEEKLAELTAQEDEETTSKTSIEQMLRNLMPVGYCKRELCEEEELCPAELRQIRGNISSFLGAHSQFDNHDTIRLLLEKRLKIFGDQTSYLAEGKWLLHVEDEDDKRLTDADVIYELITKHIIKKNPSVSILASTIPHYIEWWLENVGLSYLETQRNGRDVKRIFLFPNGIIFLLLQSYGINISGINGIIEKDKPPNWEEDKHPNSFLPEGFESLCLEQVLTVLLLHVCIGINVWLLSPKFCSGLREQDKLKKSVDEWINRDVVILMDNYNKSSLCCLEIEGSTSMSQGLIAKEGTIYFAHGKINEYFNHFKSFHDNKICLDFNQIVNSGVFNDWIEQIREIISNRSLPDVQMELNRFWLEKKL